VIVAYLENGKIGKAVCLHKFLFIWWRMIWKLLKRSKYLLKSRHWEQHRSVSSFPSSRTV